MSHADLSIGEAGLRLRDGSLTAEALVGAALDRVAERDPHYHAFTTLMADQARDAARLADRELDQGQDRGPLHGIPVAIKDLFDTVGVRTTYGSRLYEHHLPQANAPAVDRLAKAGAILIGKLATYEFATVGPSFDTPFTPPRNPWNVDHITGGSSSGCAAAVASGMLRTTIGTDTGGSIRSPASYCGIVGLKPGFDRISKKGAFPLSPSLDHVGPLSATVAEAALTLDALTVDAALPAASSLLGRDIEGLRIGYARDWFAQDPALQAGLLTTMDAAISQLSLLGARIEEVSLPDYDLFEAAGAAILHAEAFAIHKTALRERGGEFGAKSFQTLAAGLCLTADDLAYAISAGRSLRAELDAGILSRCDAIVTITTLGTALPFSAFADDKAVWTAMRTLPFNLTGHPAISIPIGLVDGLPVGMQIVGPVGSEALLCQIGHAYEMATDHLTVHPPALVRRN